MRDAAGFVFLGGEHVRQAVPFKTLSENRMSETILIVDDEHCQPGETYPVAASAREWFPPFSAAHLRTATARELYARCASMCSGNPRVPQDR